MYSMYIYQLKLYLYKSAEICYGCLHNRCNSNQDWIAVEKKFMGRKIGNKSSRIFACSHLTNQKTGKPVKFYIIQLTEFLYGILF